MMLPTHALAGLLLALPLVVYAPDLAPAALVGAALGSVLPDLDLYVGHRRTLHYPTMYAVSAAIVGLATLLWTLPALVLATFLLASAALHCRMDRYGGGLELRPWEGTSDRAVYDHVRGEWRAPKRWIPYDGSPRDLALSAVLGVPSFVLLEGPVVWFAAAVLLVGTTYAVLRRWLATVAPTVFGAVPDPVRPYVPERYSD